MGTLVAKLAVQNKTGIPRIVWLEPWAEDYTLLPGETVEFVSRSNSELPWFHLDEWPESTQVYLQAGDYPVVHSNGVRLQCGHNREAALKAGLKF
jgi:hypothetical protein